MDSEISGSWTDCPVCSGRGFEWVDAGDEYPVRAYCHPCGGLGFTEWIEEPVGAGGDADLFVDNVVAAHFDRLPPAA